MLWISIQSDKQQETTIAVTLPAAREIYRSDQGHLTMGRTDATQRELEHLIQEVLEGDKEEGEVYDREDNARIRVWRSKATIPGPGEKDRSTLVIEIRENGAQVTTIRLPNITVETSDKDEDAVVETAVGWRTLLPFLAEHGGAVYIATEKDETEIWVYVQ